ncbi:MAG: YceH family protein, partial [Nocardioides sp.]
MSELPVLDANDQRLLGALLEKQTTVPASYPLTANALRSACNQSNNRDPVVDLDLETVEQTARSLKDRGLVRIVWAATGRRTLKYHQVLDERLGLEPDERALLTVLLLRGEQAPGELRTRTERLHGFADRGEVEACLVRMAERPEPLVHELGRRPGQQDPRWIHLLGPVPQQQALAAPSLDRDAVIAGGADVRDEHVRSSYDAVATAYADHAIDELEGLPFETWLLDRVVARA